MNHEEISCDNSELQFRPSPKIFMDISLSFETESFVTMRHTQDSASAAKVGWSEGEKSTNNRKCSNFIIKIR